MERVDVKCLFLALAIAAAALFLHSRQAAAAELSVDEEPQMRRPKVCRGHLKRLVRYCRPWIKKEGAPTDPSELCCVTFLIVDVRCICRNISPYYLKIISMKKFVWTAQKCGRSIEKGTNCGGYIVPRA